MLTLGRLEVLEISIYIYNNQKDLSARSLLLNQGIQYLMRKPDLHGWGTRGGDMSTPTFLPLGDKLSFVPPTSMALIQKILIGPHLHAA